MTAGVPSDGDGVDEDDDEACAAALASLAMSPARLRRMLAGRSAYQAWRQAVSGCHAEDSDGRVAEAARLISPAEMIARCRRRGLHVAVLGHPSYPPSLSDDEEAPAVLFVDGAPAVLDHWPRVAMVGTRSASIIGREVASEMAGALATAGVVVVSGLAPGIDSAALGGAVEAAQAPCVAVLGTAHGGLASAEQQRLAHCIAGRGCVVSELPPGTPGARWRFAVRNRVMAALAQIVVVVECHDQGGALHTVRAARRRHVPVAAVPGSVRASASAGTNQLLADGAACVRHGDDVLALLERVADWHRAPARPGATAQHVPDGLLDPLCAKVLGALDHQAVGVDALVLRSGESLAQVALALERLAAGGLARSEAGFWLRTPHRAERVDGG
ncbi:MAG TPA: DNA-processing protein DprA [Acidimicrobiales bacterium]|nr:DNA-processing protein DprA [Acidimicrobiales bacterium]